MTTPGDRPIKVLVVDDYHDAVEMWAIFLRSCGYDVLTSEDGVSALQMARETMPDVVVLDLDLPGMSGASVARELRAGRATAHIPLIAASGHSGDARLADARAAGFDVIMVKPCDPPAMVQQIQALLAANTRTPAKP